MLLTEWDGECFGFSSIVGMSSQIASTRARLWNEEALSNDDPSIVIVCELWAAPAGGDGDRRRKNSLRPAVFSHVAVNTTFQISPPHSQTKSQAESSV